MKTVTVKITFKELLVAQDVGFGHYRDYVALKFKEMGFIVVDFMELRYKTFQDGNRKQYDIYTLIEGEVGKALIAA